MLSSFLFACLCPHAHGSEITRWYWKGCEIQQLDDNQGQPSVPSGASAVVSSVNTNFVAEVKSQLMPYNSSQAYRYIFLGGVFTMDYF